jgi:plastocyanin
MRFHLSSFLVAALATAVAVVPVTAVPAEYDVSMTGNRFTPSTLQIKAGDSIRFINSDKFSHVVYSLTPGHYFTSGRQAPGARMAFLFARSGSFDLVTSGEYGSRMKLHVEVASR